MKKVLCCIFLIVGCLLIIPMMEENEVIAAVRSGTTISAVGVDGTHGHTYATIVSVTPATCKSSGKRVMKCSCGQRKIITLPKLTTHKYGSAKYISISINSHQVCKTCTVCGALNVGYGNHSWSSNRCTLCGQQKCLTGMVVSSHWSYVISKGFEKYDEEEHYQKYYCNQCRVNISIPKAHNMVSGRCRECGYERCSEMTIAPGHAPTFRRYEKINDEKHNAIYFCGRCDQEIKIEEKHGVLVMKAATCTENGKIVINCSCGYHKNEEYAALKHEYVNDVCSNCKLCKPNVDVFNGTGRPETKFDDYDSAAPNAPNVLVIFSSGLEGIKNMSKTALAKYDVIILAEPACYKLSSPTDYSKLVSKLEEALEINNDMRIIFAIGDEESPSPTNKNEMQKGYATTIGAADSLRNLGYNENVELYQPTDDEKKLSAGTGVAESSTLGSKVSSEVTYIPMPEQEGVEPHQTSIIAIMEYMEDELGL